MSISLPPDLEELIKQKVATGHYTSASEVISEGLRLLQEKEELERRRDELRGELLVAQAQLRNGQAMPFDVEKIKAEVRERLQAQGD